MRACVRFARASASIRLAMVASHRGDSHSSVATRRRVAKLFDEWRETLSPSDARNLAPAAFESIVNADVFAKPETYQRFSTWLVDEYTMNDGDTLSPGSVVDYFGALLNMAFDRAMELSNGRLSVGASDFFKCLETAATAAATATAAAAAT